MGTTPAAQLARIKVNHPGWSIRKIEPNGRPASFTAKRYSSGETFSADSLGELQRQLTKREG